MRSTAALAVAISAFVLVAMSSIVTADDLIDDILLPSQGFHKGEKGKPWECCDNCVCTRSEPPECRCRDILVDKCHPNCKGCICTLSIPAQCQCVDTINELCGPRCTSES